MSARDRRCGYFLCGRDGATYLEVEHAGLGGVLELGLLGTLLEESVDLRG